MNKKTIITALLAFVAIVANAQQRFIVRDSLTQEPVAYASVLLGNETGRYTDESGTIEIPGGTERIRLSHICYEAKSISVTDISGHTVLLVPKSISLGEVRISAKAPKRMKTSSVEWMTTAAVSQSQNLVPALNMTLNAHGHQTWNKKTFRNMGWMREKDEPIYQDDTAREFYNGRIPCAKLGLEISKGDK